MEKITKNTPLEKILENPKLIKVLEKYSLPCLYCPLAKFEMKNLKIGEVAEMYGIDAEKLLEELNKKLSE
jgi:hybrid cluster-associated redox disulfide protein